MAEFDDLTASADDVINVFEKLKSIQEDLSKSGFVKDMTKGLNASVDATKRLIKALQDGKDVSAEEVDVLSTAADMFAKINNITKEVNINKIKGTQYEGEILNLTKKISEVSKASSKGMLTHLRSMMEAQADINESKAKEMTMQARILEEGEEQLKQLKEYETKLKSMYASVKAAIQNPVVATGLFLIAVADKVRDIANGWVEVSKSQGIAVSQAHEYSTILDSASATGFLMGIGFKEQVEAQMALGKQLGGANKVTKDMKMDVATIAEHYGVSAENAAKMYVKIGKSREQSHAMAENLENMARGSGLAFGEIVSDIATAGSIADKNLQKAALNARKLGLSLGDIKSASQGLLDIDSSIEAEMEAMALTGKHMNLQRAREAAAMNDMQTVQEELVKNVGSQAEWVKMSAYEQNAMAKAMNLTKEQVESLYINQKNINDLKSKEETIMGKVNLIAVKVGGVLKENAGLLAASLNFMASMVANGGKLVGVLGRIGSSIGEKLYNVLSGGAGAVGGLGGATKGGLTDGQKNSILGSMGLDNKAPTISNAANSGVSSGAQMENVSKGASSFGGSKAATLLSAAAVMIAIAGAIWILGKSVQDWNNATGKGVAFMIGTMFALVGAVYVLGITMQELGAMAENPMFWLGIAALGIIALSMMAMGKAAEYFSKAISTIADALGRLMISFGDFLNAIKDITLEQFSTVALGLLMLATPMMLIGTAGIVLMAGLPGIYGMTMAIALLSTSLMSSPSIELNNIATALGNLSQYTGTLYALAGGFSALATSMVAMSVASIAEAGGGLISGGIKKIGATLGITNETEGDKGKDTTTLADVKGAIDNLVAMMGKGAIVNLDGQQVGKLILLTKGDSGQNTTLSTGAKNRK